MVVLRKESMDYLSEEGGNSVVRGRVYGILLGLMGLG